MTTYNTGNPIGSVDPKDLYDNAQNLDNIVNGSEHSYADRLGVARRSLAGIDAAAEAVLSGLGYAPPVTYAAGISLTLTTQTVEYNGEVYAPKLSALPFTTGGTFDPAKFRVIQGVLAADLAAPGGSALVGADDGASGSLWTTVAGFIAFLLSSLGASIVGFIQSGVGAIWRSVLDKLREVERTPQDYGAVATGLVDDSAAIQKAINAVAAKGGGAVKLPAGAYKMDNGVTLASNVKLIGEPGAVIKPSDLVPLWAFRGAGTNNVKVISLTFEGTGAAFTDGNQRLLQFESASNIEISGCTFTKAREGGVSINACSDVTVSNSQFIRNYGTGLTARDGCSKITVDSCVFDLNGDTGSATSAFGRGLLLWETSNSVVVNCVFDSNTEYGLRLYSQTGDSEANRNIAISNCAFRDNGTTATGKCDLYVYNEHGDTERVTVTGCTFSTRTGNTGAVMSGTNMTLSGCSFKAITPRSTNHAVSLYGSTNVVCVGNAIQDFASAFNMSASVGHVTTNCTVADNQIDGVVEFSGGGVVGTGNVISNNRISHGGAGATDVCFTVTTASTNVVLNDNYVNGFYRGFSVASSGAVIVIRNNTTMNSGAGNGFYAQHQTDISKFSCFGNSFDSSYPRVWGTSFAASLSAYGRVQCINDATPATGGVGAGSNIIWRVGDRVINSAPSVGQPKAWTCTVAGSPGTWVSEGNL